MRWIYLAVIILFAAATIIFAGGLVVALIARRVVQRTLTCKSQADRVETPGGGAAGCCINRL